VTPPSAQAPSGWRVLAERATRLAARPGVALALPLGLAVAASWRVLPGQFQFDDFAVVVENPRVRDLAAFWRAPLLQDYLGGQRPVAELTYALNHAWGGFEPWNFHLTNLVIHLVAVVLAWAVGRQLLRLAGLARADGLATVAAGLFALHPLQSQAVSYVAQRAESLASALYLAGLLALLAADRRHPGWRAGLAWLVAAVAFLAGLGTKTIVVTLPLAWLLLAALVPSQERRAERLGWRGRLLLAAPLLAFDAFFSIRTVASLRGADVGLSVPGLTPWTYLQTQCRVVAIYLRLLVWPAGQTVDWHLEPSRLLAGPTWLLAAAFLVALVAGALALARWGRHRSTQDGAAARVAGAGVLWFFLLLAPTSSVVPIVDLLMEHRVYLASWGLFLAVAVAGDRLLDRLPGASRRSIGPALVAASWLALAGLLHARNAVWESQRALWTDAAQRVPDNPRAWYNLGYRALRDGRFEEAVADLGRGLPLVTGEPLYLGRMYGFLGEAQLRLGRLDDAERTLQQGLQLFPGDPVLRLLRVKTLHALGRDDEACLGLGLLASRPDPGAGDELETLWDELGCGAPSR
jgi:hypothetical protein